MKYKPGDKVKIKSRDWYSTNKDEDGRVFCGDIGFCKEMVNYCGKELTIDFIHTDDGKSVYVMKEPKINWGFTDGMIEGLAYEPQEKMVSLNKAVNEFSLFIMDYFSNLFPTGEEVKCVTDLFRKRLAE